MPESPTVAAELVAHSGALRRLARDLVGRCDAEDLVQDTAVRALRSPPPAPHGLFSWLATVMRNLAANRRRGEHHRRQREAEVVGAGEAPPADAEPAHRDTVRAVADALWALPEPYQGTLVLRYFEELRPAKIAQRTRVPVATVKSRLQRGLELLRVALERRDGRAWRAAIASAFGLSPSWFVPSTVLKSGAVPAACAMAVLTWWAIAPDAVAPSPVAAAGGGDPVRAPVDHGGDAATPATRASAAAAADARPDLAQPYEFELRARAVDAGGLPICGAADLPFGGGGGHAALAPPGCALALSEPMDREGRVTVKWRAHVKELVMAVGFAFQGEHASLQQVAVVAGVPADVNFVAGVAPLPAEMTDEWLAKHEAIKDSDSRTGRPWRQLFEVRGSLRAGLHPDAVFGDLLVIQPRAEGPDLVVTVDDLTSGASGGSPSGPTIRGRVFRADGQPAVDVVVWSLHARGRSASRTDAQGAYCIPASGEGPVTVRAGGGPEGLATCTIEGAGERTVPDLILATGRTLRGRVCGADGKNLDGARVEYLAPAGSDGDLATVGPDGTFAFANLPPGPGRLLLWGVAGERFPVAEQPGVLPDGSAVELDLRQRPSTNGALRVSVHGHDGETPADLEVRAWQQLTKRGAFLERSDDGAFHAHGLMAGFYRIEVGAVASGFRDLGVHWVDGTGVVDLGAVQLSQPARLQIDAPDDMKGLELYARRADIDVRADEIAPGTREVLLPAGRWLALWQRDGQLATREVDLTCGTTASLRDVR